MKSEFTKLQPKHGDAILHCGHLDSGHSHFFHVESPVSFARPDATVGKSSWIVACHPCYTLANGEASRVAVRGDGIWKGNEPEIKKYDDA